MNYWPINIATIFPSLVNKIWGSDSNNLYVVGNNGNIAWYNGTLWTRIESGTELDIRDIWGIPNGNVSHNKYLAADNVLLNSNINNELQRVYVELGMSIISVWGVSNNLIYTAGNGVVIYKNFNWEKITISGVQTIYRIRGDNHNNICGVDSPGSMIYHFNGYSWQYMSPNPNNRYWRIEIKENIIAAPGYQGEKAAITILRRNN